jgi:3-deoxy-7-phosphoheptulonate synthase
MRERHGDDLEIVMRTYTEKPRTEVDWKGFAYDPFLDGSDEEAQSSSDVQLEALVALLTDALSSSPVSADPFATAP